MKLHNSLFWKTALILTALMGSLAYIYTRSTINSSQEYHDEVTQRLNKDVSAHIVGENPDLYDGEAVNKESMGRLMHQVMAINPSTEVYLINNDGVILDKVAMDKEIKAQIIDVIPIKEFLSKNGDVFIKGDDPKEIGAKKIFSAAPIYDGDVITGYIYTIVGGREYDTIAAMFKESYVRKLELKNVLLGFASAFLIGLAALWFVTRNLNKIIAGIEKFRRGEYSHRIIDVKDGELGMVANTFNEMAADTERHIAELKSVDKLRKELIANISHDLRTPVAAIQGFAETLVQKEDLADQEKKRYLQIIAQNSMKLKKQVNDLFELSKLESNSRTIQPEPIQIAELIQDTADKYRIIANQKGVSINTLYSQQTPLVVADIVLIDRALQNIIDNALKFCKSGDVINLELNAEPDGVNVKIVDTGSGISKAELPYIFDRYKRGKLVATSQGNGLGLAIVKKIMDLHKTKIDVQSELNKGTTFSFKLPFHNAS